jgi:hypothetical protein
MWCSFSAPERDWGFARLDRCCVPVLTDECLALSAVGTVTSASMDHPAHDEDLEAYRAGEGDVVTLPVFQQTKVIPLEFPANSRHPLPRPITLYYTLAIMLAEGVIGRSLLGSTAIYFAQV